LTLRAAAAYLFAAVSRDDASTSYAFRDSAVASARLAGVARMFAPATGALLARVPSRRRARLVDLGCGPGHTTRLLAETFRDARVIGVDRSDAFLAEARRNVADCEFACVDVTAADLPGTPADLVYARFVLSHLPRRDAVVRGWFEALAPGGALVVEEVEWIATEDDVFRRYLEITRGLIAHHGGDLYTGADLGAAADGLGGCVACNAVLPFAVSTGDAATLFGMNLSAWRDDPWVGARLDTDGVARLADGLEARRAASDRETIRWGLRQVIAERG
jgi:SAM-dependent methyltransferase